MLLILGNTCSFTNISPLPRKKLDTVKSASLGVTAKGFTPSHNLTLLLVLLHLPRPSQPTTLMWQLLVLWGPAQTSPPSWSLLRCSGGNNHWCLCDSQCFSYHIGQADAYSGIHMPYLNRVLAASHLLTLCSQVAWVLSGSSPPLWKFFLGLLLRLLSIWPLEYQWCSPRLHPDSPHTSYKLSGWLRPWCQVQLPG